MSDLGITKRYPVPYSTTKHSFGFKVGKIACAVEFPILKEGITGLINDYGLLYYGTMPKEYFLYQHFLSKKHAFIRQLNNAPDEATKEFVSDMSFWLELCRAATKSKWRWPALMNRYPNGSIQMRTGSSRGLATILTTSEPWKHLPILFYEKPGFKPDQVLENYIEVTTDDQLHNILDCENDPDSWDPEVHMALNFNKINNVIWPTLENINGGAGDFEFGLRQSTVCYENFSSWRKKYSGKQTLHVYTDWPKLIQDTCQIWNVVHAGPSRPIIDDLKDFGGRVGRLENICRIIHNDTNYTKDFTLYVVNPRRVDVGDLLPWLDLEHTTYIEQNWDFLLYRKDRDYKNTFINCSFVE